LARLSMSLQSLLSTASNLLKSHRLHGFHRFRIAHEGAPHQRRAEYLLPEMRKRVTRSLGVDFDRHADGLSPGGTAHGRDREKDGDKCNAHWLHDVQTRIPSKRLRREAEVDSNQFG